MEAGAPDTPERTGEPGRLDAFGVPADAIAERVNAVIAAAEAAAAGIKEDAEAEARSYLAGSKQRAEELVDQRAKLITELTDSLISQATDVKREFDSLMHSLEEGQGRLKELMPEAAGAAAEPQAAIDKPSADAASPPPPTPTSPALQSSIGSSESAESALAAEADAERGSTEAAPAGSEAGPADSQEAPQAEDSPTRQARQADRARLVAMQMALSGSGRGEIADRLRREFGVTEPDPILDELARSVGL